jgi:hypothetical protein
MSESSNLSQRGEMFAVFAVFGISLSASYIASAAETLGRESS